MIKCNISIFIKSLKLQHIMQQSDALDILKKINDYTKTTKNTDNS